VAAMRRQWSSAGSRTSRALGPSIDTWSDLPLAGDHLISLRRSREMIVMARNEAPSGVIVPLLPGLAVAESGGQGASSAASR